MKPNSGTTPPSDSSQPITASAAFRNRFSAEEYERIEKPAKVRIALFEAGLKAALELTADPRQQHDDELAELWRKGLAQPKAYEQEFEQAIGISYPETLEDWDRLANAVGMPFDLIQSGDYTLERVIGEAHTFIIKHRMIAHAKNPVDSKPLYKPDGWSKDDLCVMAEISGNTFIRICDEAGINRDGNTNARRHSKRELKQMIDVAKKGGPKRRQAATAWTDLLNSQ